MAAYDVIVVGARCAGSPTAMLLAQKGHRVLLIDRATFPSDTMSTHVVHPLAVAALDRWGLLHRLAATGCPQIDTYTFDLAGFNLAGAPGTDDSPFAYCPRRTILDALLVEAAADSGADVREGFVVDEVLMEGGCVVGITGHSKDHGSKSTEYARVVVGADGRNSVVAGAVHPHTYNERAPLLAIYYAYWSGLPTDGRFESYMRARRGFAAAETHDGLTMVVAGWPYEEFAANKRDLEGSYLRTLSTVPEFAERLRDARRESRIMGAPTPNFFRQPYGPGWALVGDAGYLKDPITAQGILDAFRDAEACARGLDEALRGDRAFADSMQEYQRARDESALAMFDFTCQLASFSEPSPEMRELFAAMEDNPTAMDGFARMNAGTISPAEFLSPQNISAIVGRA
ncbi:MAG: NAD(P)/FAD-dependent oxidoreductase [Steroidobacteraceae bacterium]|nr:NAD(P)/FAD-dependent oxidoreductase [Steroidobacteraceae bacterium]